MDICAPLQLSNMVSVPTRVSASSQKCIDPVLTNCSSVSNVLVIHLDFSDHALVTAQLTLTVSANRQATCCSRRRMNARSLQRLPVALAQRSVHVLEANNVNAMWQEWRDKFLAALDDVAP